MQGAPQAKKFRVAANQAVANDLTQGWTEIGESALGLRMAIPACLLTPYRCRSTPVHPLILPDSCYLPPFLGPIDRIYVPPATLQKIQKAAHKTRARDLYWL